MHTNKAGTKNKVEFKPLAARLLIVSLMKKNQLLARKHEKNNFRHMHRMVANLHKQ